MIIGQSVTCDFSHILCVKRQLSDAHFSGCQVKGRAFVKWVRTGRAGDTTCSSKEVSQPGTRSYLLQRDIMRLLGAQAVSHQHFTTPL